MGSMFAQPVLLVEGDDDYRVWIQVARSGANICVLPCNGDEIRAYQKTLERTFSALSENGELRGYALLDGDKPKPQATQDSPQRYVKFVVLDCHETENLYLADELLSALGHSWEEAKKRIAAEADNYGAKSATLKAIINEDRKAGDFKAVINEIAEILDPKRLLWSVRLGKFLGRTRPVGMMADFLGADLTNAIWP